ncbi:MAG: monovalent cation:proton antiporter-2 (CPA2) family protein [Proteobacteria bacterium]|nr:monovalent cation:proton antiporter-2 (CPA2) family protein [Pseudomonadota bacterium]
MPEFNLTDLERLFWETLALIAAACLFVPLARRLGLGTVLGYLITGVVVGATLSLGLAEQPEDLLHFAEFGVVLFLFVIGLELKPARLWDMRADIFGLGLVQVLVSGIVLSIPPLLFGLSWQMSTVIGLGLALSSTALVMQMLDERRERTTTHGRKTFSILLFQDIAIVPLLLLVQLMAPVSAEVGLTDGLIKVGIGIIAIAFLILVGRFALDPMFRLLANARMPEIMTAGALGVVIAAASLMDLAGMSYAMGAFIAGVMLAESSYRHEVEANIEPFRGLFLGLFFIAVGLSLDLRGVAENWVLILVSMPAFMVLKALVIFAAARLFGSDRNTSIRISLYLPQHGEFGFVLFSAAAGVGLFDAKTAAVLVAIVTLSMAVSPFVGRLESIFIKPTATEIIDEDYSDAGGKVLMIGFGRFGQVASQPLLAENIDVTIIDNDANRVREADRFGFRIHFGDGTRRDVMRAAGANEAALILVCVDDQNTADKIVDLVRAEFRQAKLAVRSYDRRHAIQLMNREVDTVVRETFDAALRMGGEALSTLGLTDPVVAETIDDVRIRDEARLAAQAKSNSGVSSKEDLTIEPTPLRHPEPATTQP